MRGVRDPKTAEKGVALVVALLVAAILIAVALQLAYTTTVDRKLVRNQSQAAKNHYAARGVVILATTHLRDDLGSEKEEERSDSFHDVWAGTPVLPEEEEYELEEDDPLEIPEGGPFSAAVGEVSVEYVIADEERKICLNNLALEELHLKETEEPEAPKDPKGEGGDKSDPSQVQKEDDKEKKKDPKALAEERKELTRDLLENVLVQLGISEGEAETLVEEMEKAAPFASVRELGRFEPITAEILEGTVDDWGETTRGLVDLLTVHSTGAININTAPREVLIALLTDRYGKDAEYFADQIIEFRAPLAPDEEEEILEEEDEGEEEEGDGEGDEEEEEEDEPTGGVFHSVGDLPESIPGLEEIFGPPEGTDDKEAKEKGAALRRILTARSRYFAVTVEAGEDPHRKEYRFVLRRGQATSDPMPVLIWEERELPSEEGEYGEDFP
jgi:hypothetical protein